MGSRMEALPSSAAAPTSNSSSMNKNTCTQSPPFNPFFVSAPLRPHLPCRRCTMFQANGGHRWSGKAILGQDHLCGTGSFNASQPSSEQVTKLLQHIVRDSESSPPVKVFASGEKNWPSTATALINYQSPLHQFLSVGGLISVTHGAAFPTFLGHSLVRTNPFVLEVIPGPQKELMFHSDQKVEATCAMLNEPPSDRSAEAVMEKVQESNERPMCKYEHVPADAAGGDLFVSCSKTSLRFAEDGGSVESVSDVVETVGSCPAPEVDDSAGGGTITPTCLDSRRVGDANDENDYDLDGLCSSDDCESSTDEEEEEEEYDPQESDCESDDGATGDWGLLPCVEISPPKNGGHADAVEGPCLSFTKLLSEESGYCEGTSSEEGGKAECSGWWRLPVTTGDDEVDWDASDDSGSEVDFNEDLLRSFEVLSPQVCCNSPKVTPPAKSGAAVTPSVSLLTPSSCATHSIRAESRGVRVTACFRSYRQAPKHDRAATSKAGLECSVVSIESADMRENEHQAEVSGSRRQQPESSSPSPRNKSCQQTKRVSFAEGSSLMTVHRICAWSYAYREARRGPWEQLARDRVHFKRRIDNVAVVLEPCLAARRAVAKGLIVDCVSS